MSSTGLAFISVNTSTWDIWEVAFELPINPDAVARTGYRAAGTMIDEYLRLEIWETVGSYFWKRIAVFNDVVCPLTLIVTQNPDRNPKISTLHTYSVSFLSRKTREAIKTSVTLKQNSHSLVLGQYGRWPGTSQENYQKQHADTGFLDNMMCALPWPLLLLAFPEHHQLHYDPGGHTKIMSSYMEITLEKDLIILHGCAE